MKPSLVTRVLRETWWISADLPYSNGKRSSSGSICTVEFKAGMLYAQLRAGALHFADTLVEVDRQECYDSLL